MVPTIKRREYAMRVAVEFLQDGQAAQQRLQAALPQQQASCENNTGNRN